MKYLNLFFILSALLFISNISFAQAWLPKPIESPYLNSMEGTWVSEPYQFMGNTNNDEVVYKMILNGQYMEVDIKRTDDKGFTYEGKEIISVSPDGTLSGAYYDIFGNTGSNSYSASMTGSKMNLKSASPIGKGTREIVIDGDSMVQTAVFTMKDRSGAETSPQNISIMYKKIK